MFSKGPNQLELATRKLQLLGLKSNTNLLCLFVSRGGWVSGFTPVPAFAWRTCSYFLWFEFYCRWKWSTYLVCTVWASWKLLMRRDHLTPENNISSDSARNSVITCNYVKLRHVSHTPEHGNIARRAEGSWFLSSWYDVPLSLSCKIIQRIQVWHVLFKLFAGPLLWI